MPLNYLRKCTYRLITNIHFWVWAATHRKDFNEFELWLTAPVRISIQSFYWRYKLLYIRISGHAIELHISPSPAAADEFVKICGNQFDSEFIFGDYPF